MAGRVRQPIDVDALEAYINAHIPAIKTPLDIKQFGFGQSNPTYLLTSRANGQRYVLRKKPPGKLLSKTAHNVSREHRIIAALGQIDVPVPKAYGLCEDENVIGTAFYLMEFLDGRIFEDATLPEVGPEERSALWKAAVETLASFHAVDYKKVGLEKFGREGGFYDRQVATWRQICAAQERAVDVETKKAVGPIPHFDSIISFFTTKSSQPHDRSTLVHGDYKIDNMVFHPTEPRVIGILDWEMSTLGHPLSDLANLLHPFYTTDLPLDYAQGALFKPGAVPGLPTRETVMKWYADKAGWDPSREMGWAMSFSIFRASAIAQGIAARVARRQATSEKAAQYADAFKVLGEFAWRLVEGEMGRSEKGKL